MTDRPGPRPWFGCDTSGEAWKAYCEAWEHIYRRKSSNMRFLIAARRGNGGLDVLDHNIKVVKADYAGEIDDREEIPRLLQL